MTTGDTPIDRSTSIRARTGAADLLERLGIGVFSSTPEGRLLSADHAFLNLMGISDLHRAEGFRLEDLWPTPEARRRLVARLLAEGQLLDQEVELQRPDGTALWVRLAETLTESDSGEPLIEGVVQDVSAQVALRQSLTEERQLFIAGPSVVVKRSIGPGWPIEHVSPNIERVLGYSADELLGSSHLFTDLLHAGDVPRVAAETAFFAEMGVPTFVLEYRLRHRDGSYRWFSDYCLFRRDPDHRVVGVQSYILDITDRRTAHEEVQLQRTALSSLEDAVVVTDRGWKILWVNPAFTKLTGYPPSEVLGKTPRLLDSGTHEEDFFSSVGEMVAAGKTWRGDIVNRRKNRETYIQETTITPFRAEGFAVTHFIELARDVTREREQRRQREHLDRLSLMGRLAGGVAHDLSNILMTILAQSELLMARRGADPEVHQALEVVIAQGARGTSVTHQLLDFSRRSASEPHDLDLVAVLGGFVRLIRRVLPESIAVRFETDLEQAIASIDDTQFHQILMNLAVNANDAMPEGGELVLRLDESIASWPGSPPVPRDRPWLHITIHDNGYGIADEHIEHIFEPFFTTKQKGHGTGLGLAQVFGLIQQHEGQIAVESCEAGGTTFHLLLPRKLAVSHEVEIPQIDIVQRRYTVLVVDDSPDIVAALREALEYLGYLVATASDGQEALALACQTKSRVDCVLTDLVMPTMGGVDLARRLKEAGIEVPIVAVSGYSVSDELTTELHRLGVVEILQKPVRIAELNRALGRVLD